MGLFDDDSSRKRTLGIRDKQILFKNANGKCENPTCNKKIGFDEMQVGHKTAFSKGGNTTFKNSVCLCYRCNRLQGTDSWATFLKKQGVIVANPKAEIKTQTKASLEKMKLDELKQLAKKHDVSVKGKIIEHFFNDEQKAPTKTDYINKLTNTITEKELTKIAKNKKK
jgi:hypothetical protein